MATTGYSCPKCKYTTRNRHTLLLHLLRKKPCYTHGTTETDDGADAAALRLLSELKSACGTKQRTRDDGTKFICGQCHRRFNFRSTLSRHQKACCQNDDGHSKKEQDSIHALQKRCDDLQRQMEDLRQRPVTTNTTTHNTNNQNGTVNNIQINALGNEDLASITPQIVDTCIRKTTKGLVELTEKIHFDTEVSNQNLRASLLYPDHVEFHDGFGWRYGPKNRIVRQVVDASHMIMSNRYDESYDDLRTSMSSALFAFVDSWMRKMTKSNAQVYVDVMAEVYCSILNRTRDVGSEHNTYVDNTLK